MRASGKPTEAFRSQVKLLLGSKTFRNKGSLRRLLSYLTDKSLAGEQENLKEYTIGVEAFGKPEGYDPQLDASVRVQAGKLRQKLAEYYRTEGVNDPIVIEFPKGHFQLNFGERRSEDFQPLGHVFAREVRRWRLIAYSLGVALIVLASFVAYRRPEPSQLKGHEVLSPELKMVWEPYLSSSRPVVISLGTPLFTKFNGDFFRSPRINEWGGWGKLEYKERLRQLEILLGDAEPSPSYIYTGVGEATGAFLLGTLYRAWGKNVALRRSSLLSWENFTENNLIFLGAPKYNLHLEEIPVEQFFLLGRGGIRNLDPRPGESSIYGEVWNDDRSARVEDHGVVIRLAGLHGQGVVTVLAGRSTEGTLAAVEYVTQPRYATELINKIREESGEIPQSYHVLIGARFSSEVPLEVSYVTHRVGASRSQTATSTP